MPTAPTTQPNVGIFPPAPDSLNDDVSAFNTKANNFVSAQVTYVPEANNLSGWMNSTAQQVYNNANETNASAISALSSKNQSVLSASNASVSEGNAEASNQQASSAASASASSANAASASESLASEYADNDEDVPISGVFPTAYSARHWAAKAQAIAGGTADNSLALGGVLAADVFELISRNRRLALLG